MLKCDFSILDIQAAPDLTPGHAAGKKFFSYMSIGQIAGDAPYLAQVLARGIRMLSFNAEWNSHYPDLSDPRWANYVINDLTPIAINKGFDGFFLDTVDAVETLSQLQPSRAHLHRQGMVNIIQGLKAAYPSKELLLNRGFAVFDSVRGSVKGMVVEELFQRDDYSARDATGIAQLLARIAPVTQAGLPVYVVDYVSSGNVALADSTSERISNLGFNPLIVPQELHGIILAPRWPSFTRQPTGGNPVPAGGSISLSATVAGTPPLQCQWRLNEQDVPGATSATLSLNNLTPAAAGSYALNVRNAAGSITSTAVSVAVVVQDADRDLLPDQWERDHGLDPNNAADANSDPDADRATNLNEYNSGTNPRDARSVLKLSTTRSGNNALRLGFRALAGRTYTIQSRSTMSGGTWTQSQQFAASPTDQDVSQIVAIETKKTRFFRVVTPAVP